MLLVTIAFFGNSCGSSKRTIRKKVLLDTLTVTAKNNPIDIYRASAAKEWEIVNTTVALSFNMTEKTASGMAWLELHPYCYTTDSIILDAKSMRIDSVVLTYKGKSENVSFTANDSLLRIRFNRTYTSADDIGLYIRYLAMPYSDKSGGSAAINDDKGLYFINTDHSIPNKPVQIWTQGETEANSHWLPTIDKPNQRTTTRIKLTVPDSFTTLSNGYLEQQILLGNQMRTDVWVMDKPIQVYAIMFAIGKFSIVHDRMALDKPVAYYVEPEFGSYAKEMFKNTPEMIEFFSKVTETPYPWNKYSQVVVRDYVSGAMENTSASLFGEFMNATHRELLDGSSEDVVSHELFHQWFGDYVTAESWTNLTLNESFATFGEQLWREYKYGKASAQQLGIKDLWNYVYGKGQRDDPALVRFHYADKEDMFDGVSYQKGASILRYLRVLTGEAPFSKAMGIYLHRNALNSAEASQWRLAVEEATGKDWNWFFEQWYYKGGHPILDMKYDYNDVAKILTVTVTQTQNASAYRLPVNIRIIYNDSNSIASAVLTAKKEIFTYPYRNGVKPVVVIDDEHVVVGEENYNLKPWQWLKIYESSKDNVINKQLAVGACRKVIEDSLAQVVLGLALTDTNEAIRELALQNLLQVKQVKYRTPYKPQIIMMAENEKSYSVRAAAFDLLGLWEVDEADRLMYSAVNDSSYAVAGAALNALSKIHRDTAYVLARQLAATLPKGDLETSIWDILAKEGKDEDFVLFERRAVNSYGRMKFGISSGLSTYIRSVKDEHIFDKATAMMYELAKDEPIKSFRLSLGSYFVYAADYYKDRKNNVKTYPEKNAAEARLDKLKGMLQQLMNGDSDEGNKAAYKEYLKKLQ